MKLNRLDQLKQVTVEEDAMLIDSKGPPVKVSTEKSIPAAYELSSMDGRVVLFYRHHTEDKPQIWFQDLSCTWHFIANSFTDYFRLMVAHLGLPRWLYVFTETGLDPAAKQWFRFLAPERLAADLESARARYSNDHGVVDIVKKEEKTGGGNKLNWSQIEKTSTKPVAGKANKGKKKKDEEPSSKSGSNPSSTGFGRLSGRRDSGDRAGRPGSASRARPSSAK